MCMGSIFVLGCVNYIICEILYIVVLVVTAHHIAGWVRVTVCKYVSL